MRICPNIFGQNRLTKPHIWLTVSIKITEFQVHQGSLVRQGRRLFNFESFRMQDTWSYFKG